MNAADKAPSPKSRRNMLGIANPARKADPTAVLPKMCTNTRSRAKPPKRERRVIPETTRTAEESWEWGVSPAAVAARARGGEAAGGGEAVGGVGTDGTVGGNWDNGG